MADFEIHIKTKADLEAAKNSSKEMDKLTDSSKKAGKSLEEHIRATDRLTGEQSRLLRGLRALGNQFPLLGAAIEVLKNPFTIIAAVGVAAVTAIRQALKEAKESQDAWTGAADKVQITVDAYSDAAKAAKALADALKDIETFNAGITSGLEDQIKLIEESIAGQIRLLEAQKDVEAAKIEAGTNDPVERARKLKENELIFGARIGGLQGSLPGQQAALLQKQIDAEKAFQRGDLAEMAPPNEAALRQGVGAVENDRAALQTALVANRRAYQRAALLRMALSEGPDLNVLADKSPFTAGQRAALQADGAIRTSPTWPGGFIDVEKIRQLLPGAEDAVRGTRGRVDTLRASLRMGLAALPAGIATAGDIPGFIDTAESEAARLQNESYLRQQTLEARKGRLLREQQVGGAERALRRQAAGSRGDASISDAQSQQARQQDQDAKRVLDSLGRNGDTSVQLLRQLLEIINRQGGRLDALKPEIERALNREANRR